MAERPVVDSRHQFVRVGLLLDGSEAHGLLSFVRTLLSGMNRRVVRPVGVFLGPGRARDVLGAMCDEVADLHLGCLYPLTRPGRGRCDPVNILDKARIFVRAVTATAAAIRRHRLDLVHVNMYPLHLVAGLACRMTGAGCVWHWHGPFHSRGVFRVVARLGFRCLADRIACISRFVAGTLPPSARPIACVVYNGVQTAKIASAQRPGRLRSRLQLSGDCRLVGMFGAISPRKGHEYFIRAAAGVAASMPNVRFVIVGTESAVMRERLALQRRLWSLAEELGVSEKVIFAGHLDDAPMYMGDCDVICMPTVPIGLDSGEGFGLVMAEAMAAGAPVVATNCGAPPEVIEDDVSGLLVAPRSADGLAAAILSLLNDPARRRRMVQAARRRVREHFDAGKVAEAMETVYLESRRRRSAGT